jgi:hypothetical protein
MKSLVARQAASAAACRGYAPWLEELLLLLLLLLQISLLRSLMLPLQVPLPPVPLLPLLQRVE